MKILTIGDLHGLPDWKKADPEKYDVIVFLGDYVDSHHLADDAILTNLDHVLNFKKANPEKVKLLWGNHEISYLYRSYRCTGYRYDIAEPINQKLTENFNLFQMAFLFRNYLWTHAGFHQEYYNKRILPVISTSDKDISKTLERLFNGMYDPLFEVGYERGGWNRKAIGGPFWIDSSRLLEKPLKGFHQIVGHTPVKTIEHHLSYENDPNTSVTLCDCIERGDGSFYKLEI
jgi:hypothetical protein